VEFDDGGAQFFGDFEKAVEPAPVRVGLEPQVKGETVGIQSDSKHRGVGGFGFAGFGGRSGQGACGEASGFRAVG